MVPQPLLMRLLLLAAAASAATAAGNGCSSGCNLALGSFTIGRNENLTYIARLFGIDDYQKLKPYNPRSRFSNLDFIPAGERVNVYFPCRCLALPAAPFSTYLAGSFPYKVIPLDTYSSIAAKFSNLTTADWLMATNGYPSNNMGGRTVTVNVTVNCSCGDPAVSPEYKLFLTYPLGEGETFDSVAEKNGFLLESDMDLFRKYNPANDSRIVYIPLRGED